MPQIYVKPVVKGVTSPTWQVIDDTNLEEVHVSQGRSPEGALCWLVLNERTQQEATASSFNAALVQAGWYLRGEQCAPTCWGGRDDSQER